MKRDKVVKCEMLEVRSCETGKLPDIISLFTRFLQSNINNSKPAIR